MLAYSSQTLFQTLITAFSRFIISFFVPFITLFIYWLFLPISLFHSTVALWILFCNGFLRRELQSAGFESSCFRVSVTVLCNYDFFLFLLAVFLILFVASHNSSSRAHTMIIRLRERRSVQYHLIDRLTWYRRSCWLIDKALHGGGWTSLLKAAVV